MSRSRFTRIRIAIAVTAIPLTVSAADKTFLPASGNWNDSANWSPVGVPGVGDIVTLPFNGTVTFNTTYITDADRLFRFVLDRSAFSQGSNSGLTRLATQYSYVGMDHFAEYLQGGFSNPGGDEHNVLYDLNVGYNPGSEGHYLMNSGELNVGRTLSIGVNSIHSEFYQTGGITRTGSTQIDTFNSFVITSGEHQTGSIVVHGAYHMEGPAHTAVNGPLSVIGPRFADSKAGLFELTGGTLDSAGSAVFVQNGAYFTQSGGTHNVSGNLYSGFAAAPFEGGTLPPQSLSSYWLQDGVLVTSNTIVGMNRNGQFLQDGGSSRTTNLTLGQNTSPANFTSANGTYNQSGGSNIISQTLSVSNSDHAGGYYYLHSGTLTTANTDIGVAGDGFFEQSGGDHTVGNLLRVGNGYGVGSYTLTGGTLHTADSTIGSNDATPSAFTQSGGTHQSSGLLRIASGMTGSYNLSGTSAALIAKDVSIGSFGGTGSFNHSAGSASINKLTLGLNGFVTGTGHYTLSGDASSLSAGNAVVGYDGIGTFDQSAGKHTVSGDLTLGLTTTGKGTYAMTGSSILQVAGSIYAGNSGRATLDFSGNANLSAKSLLLGQSAGSVATATLSGNAHLEVSGDAYIGYAGNGTFTQSGGSSFFDGTLHLGTLAGSNARFDLAGGILVTSTIDIQHGATFNMSGGTIIGGGLPAPALTPSPAPAVQGVDLINNGIFTQSGGIAHLRNMSGTGVTSLAPGASISASRINQASLHLQSSGSNAARLRIEPAAAPGSVNSHLTTLAIVSPDSIPSQLDLTNTNLVISGVGASPLAPIRDLLISGYKNGAWNGAGIVSSTAAQDHSYAIGYAKASDVFGAAGGTVGGEIVSPDSLILRFTRTGDATLDGKVDFQDLVKIAQNYGAADGTSQWSHGDFNYDGDINFQDLVMIAQNYGSALPIPLAASADFSHDLAAVTASVPEPLGALAMLCFCYAANPRSRRIRPLVKQ